MYFYYLDYFSKTKRRKQNNFFFPNVVIKSWSLFIKNYFRIECHDYLMREFPSKRWAHGQSCQ